MSADCALYPLLFVRAIRRARAVPAAAARAARRARRARRELVARAHTQRVRLVPAAGGGSAHGRCNVLGTSVVGLGTVAFMSDNHIAICTVNKAPYVGMEIDVYESPETNLYDSQITFYMHKDSRKKFPMVEHVQAQRTMDGIAKWPSIRLRERMLHDGTLRCATCPRRPSIGHGTMHFVIDSTTEEEPSNTALHQHGFLEKKIADNKAQIICRDCELTKTYKGSPGNQGTSRPRRVPIGDL